MFREPRWRTDFPENWEIYLEDYRSNAMGKEKFIGLSNPANRKIE